MFTEMPESIIFTVILCIVSYLLGSIPNGVIIGKKFAGLDVREHGSKNMGATNSIRTLGAKLGYTVFALDCLKGAVVIVLVKYILSNNFFTSPIPIVIYGIFAVLGHVFPIYIGFKGGKAVATSLGLVLALTPLPALICLIIFWLIIWLVGYVGLASCTAAVTMFIISIIMHFLYNNDVAILNQVDLITLIFYFLIVVMIIYRHKQNFIRMARHEEHNIHARVNNKNRKIRETKK